MYVLDNIKEELAERVNKILKKKIVTSSSFVTPPDSKLGDLSLPCFAIGKEFNQNPVMMAQKIIEGLVADKLIENSSVAGPYVNITLAISVIGDIIKEIQKQGMQYGSNTLGKKKRVMLEYANGNTHKEYHVGHLRNIAFGDAVNRILAANGYTTIPVSYINDFGIHVAKTLWYYMEVEQPSPVGGRSYGWLLGSIYSDAEKILQGSPERKLEVAEVMKAIESRKGEIYELWKKTRQWSLDQFVAINKELGVNFETTFYENDYIADGLKMVEKFKKEGILIESQGAIIADLEKYNLGVLVVIRSDGTALYPVADFALTIHKVKKYKLDTSLWVVDIRQGQYLHQMFKVLELAGLKAKLAHLPYEFVKLPSGMMSSRSGNIISYEDLKEEALRKTTEEIIKRHADWNKEKIEAVSRVLAFGALKFEMVKVSGEKVITFDMETALRFDGYTAAYLQYTYARIKSLQKKVSSEVGSARSDLSGLQAKKEKDLVLKLGHFSEIVITAGVSYQPSEVARYLYELAQLFNEYYHEVPILNDTTIALGLAKARLDLALATSVVIQKGLNLLGIDTIDEM
jgi:arginyl-tRNA synthetase